MDSPLDRIGSLLTEAQNLSDDFVDDFGTGWNRRRATRLCADIDTAIRSLRRLEATPTDEQLRDEADDRRLAEHLGK